MTSLQAIRRIGDVADELDRFDAGFRALGDREDQIDAVVRLLDDFGNDAHVIAAGAAIDFGDALGVGLHHRARQRPARLGLDFRRKLLVLDLLVTFEGDAADDRVFHHGHHETPAGLVDSHVLEQAGLDQRLQAVVDSPLIEAPAGSRLEIRTDGLDVDAPVPLHRDRGSGLGNGRRRHKHSGQRSGDRHREHDQGGQQASPHSHSNIHAPSALVIPRPARTPTNRQIPICCPACSQFCRGGKRPIAVQFHFHSKTLPIGHVTKKPFHDAARCRMSL